MSQNHSSSKKPRARKKAARDPIPEPEIIRTAGMSAEWMRFYIEFVTMQQRYQEKP